MYKTTYQECVFIAFDSIHPYSMLSVSAVPTLVVINNKTGSILTSWGMEAIECWSQHTDRSNGKSNHKLLEHWRKGNSGVSYCTKVAGVCAIL